VSRHTPGGLAVHGDGVELHRLEYVEHLPFSASVMKSGWYISPLGAGGRSAIRSRY
jgi:hypothetical protein